MLRFITSEGRFGPFIDKLLENQFRSILARGIDPAFDVEVTFASATSPFLWPPPQFNEKVLAGLNEGALFYTYVGHGFEKGFDTLHVGRARHPILHVDDVARVDIENTPPIVLVLACTTAMFDGVRGDGIGEALLRRPNGPVAYWGATRVCHPIYNTVVGDAMARRLTRADDDARLGDILDAAREHAVAHPPDGAIGLALKSFAQVEDLDRLMREGAMMYVLLGDPALKVASPRGDLEVAAAHEADAKRVSGTVRSALPDGTKVTVSLELPRNRSVEAPAPVANPQDPAQFDAIRRKHARMNDWALKRLEIVLRDGAAAFSLPFDQDEATGLIVKAWARSKTDVHQGAAVLP